MSSNSSSNGRFGYKPLTGPDIRILVLRPSHRPSSPVECEIIHQPLPAIKVAGTTRTVDTSSAIPYEALSYTWGPNLGTEFIHLLYHGEPESTRTVVAVTDNLKAALVSLRLEDEDRYLWIDTICINQDDDDEKNRQILRMLRIYQGAERVVVWLGDENESGTTGPAMRHMVHLQQKWRQRERVRPPLARACLEVMIAGIEMTTIALMTCWLLLSRNLGAAVLALMTWDIIRNNKMGDAWQAWFAYLPMGGVGIMNTGQTLCSLPMAVADAHGRSATLLKRASQLLANPAPKDEVIDGLANLFARHWFHRMWIIQEASAATKNAIVVCGCHQISWNTLIEACAELAALGRGWRQSPYERTRYHQARHVTNPAPQLDSAYPSDPLIERRLLVLLCRFNTQQATVLHDMVYGLLGMSAEIQQQVREEQEGRGNHPAAKLEPDCTLPLDEAYSKVAKFLIESSGNLRLFRACIGERSLTTLPSWVPDWSISGWRNLDGITKIYTTVTPTSAIEALHGSPSRKIAQVSDDLKTVTVRGITMGWVSTDPVHIDVPDTEEERYFMRVHILVFLSFRWVGTTRIAWKIPKLAWRAFMYLLSGVGLGHLGENSYSEAMEVLGFFQDAHHGTKAASRAEHYKAPLHDASSPGGFHQTVPLSSFEAVLSAKMFRIPFPAVTFSHQPRVGDTICLLEGADIPYLIRKRGAGNTWEMVGPAAFTAPIDQAYWKRFRDEGVKLEEFILD